MVHNFDFLVIGSGIAGMSLALKVADKGKVAIICKTEFEEANTYFESNAARKAAPTEYAKTQGVETISTQNCWWWLRTPGIYAVDTCGVHDTGAMDDLGCYVNNDQAGVRPALWVTIP